MVKLSRPVIGISLDREEAGGYAPFPWYALRENYAESVSRHGAVPVMLPHTLEAVADYLELIDGLIITGGNFDIDPSYYGIDTRHDTVITKDKRTQFEMEITKGALASNMPILGICGGQQLLNVVLGGSLIQHIPDSIPSALPHEQENPRNEPGHMVHITPGTLLHQLVGKGELAVNSSHHQAVEKPAPGVLVNAVAPDGVIEGIEYPHHPFCLGVQWHPEYTVTEGDSQIFAAFIAASALRKGV